MLCAMASSLMALLWCYLTGNLQEVRLKPGDRLESNEQKVFIVTSGTGHVVRDGPGGHDILMRVVRTGAVVEHGYKLMAETNLDLLAVPARFNRRAHADA
jgi:hypothetical protein